MKRRTHVTIYIYQNICDENDMIRVIHIQSFIELRNMNSVVEEPDLLRYQRNDNGMHMNPHDLGNGTIGLKDIQTEEIYRCVEHE